MIEQTTNEVPVDRIKDGGAQMRVEMRPETVNDYAADMLGGATFPPVVVFYDGADYWLGDGFHRVAWGKRVPATPSSKDDIERLTKEFLERGGAITHVGRGVTGLQPPPKRVPAWRQIGPAGGSKKKQAGKEYSE